MSDLTFKMRLGCQYSGTGNEVTQLRVENLVNNEWLTLDLNTKSPGFDIFMYAILTCQHMYFRVNAAERQLQLSSSNGEITVSTDQHRNMEQLHISFNGKLQDGSASADDIEYITERMGLCPVSINLKECQDTETTVSFEAAD